MTCPNCSFLNRGNMPFCVNCGSNLPTDISNESGVSSDVESSRTDRMPKGFVNENTVVLPDIPDHKFDENTNYSDDYTKPEINWQNIKTGEVFLSESIMSLVQPKESQFGDFSDSDSEINLNYAPPSEFPDEAGRTILDKSIFDQPTTTLARVFRDDSPTFKPISEISPNYNFSGQSDDYLSQGSLVLNRYLVREKLASGGFGQIYLVSDEKDYLKPLLVLKMIPMEMFSFANSDQTRVKSIYKEWKVVSDTYPDKIVHLLGIRELNVSGSENLCLFMEFMAGGNLHALVKEWQGDNNQLTPVQISQTTNFFKQVCESLYVLHKNELLHRDIKPANILLDGEKEICKLSDFELLQKLNSGEKVEIAGTIEFMSPEAIKGEDLNIASDIFSLGATFYQCLSGKNAFGDSESRAEYTIKVIRENQKPVSLLELNPIIPPELDQIILRCLEYEPENRPSSVKEILRDLDRIGSPLDNASPTILAQLLIEVMSAEDRTFLVKTLKNSNYRSKRELDIHVERDLIEEYCYTVPPDKILADNFTVRQLIHLADILHIKFDDSDTREEIIQGILQEIGFLRGNIEIHGLEAAKLFLENSISDFANAVSINECSGTILSAFTSLEITIDLLIRFYGQLFYGAGFETHLARHANGKKRASTWTFGEKTKILQILNKPPATISERAKSVFKVKLFGNDVFELLKSVSNLRNSLAHQSELKRFNEVRKIGQKFLMEALEAVNKIIGSKNIPRIVQITSLQHDVYGRHFYHGSDDRGRIEKIFTPLPLKLGEIYLFFPLTNPARIDPLIFPYEYNRN